MKEWLDRIDSKRSSLSEDELTTARDVTVGAILDVVLANVPGDKKSAKMTLPDGSGVIHLFRTGEHEAWDNGYVGMFGGFQIKGRNGYICNIGTNPNKVILISSPGIPLRSLTEKEAVELRDIFQSLEL